MWVGVGMTLWWEHQWQRGWQSWANEHVRVHLSPAMQAYQLYPQTGWSADPRSWKSSVTMDTMDRGKIKLFNIWQTQGNVQCTIKLWPCGVLLRKWYYTEHTAHFSTFPALLAHFTSASSRTNSCLVRLANWTISIFLKNKTNKQKNDDYGNTISLTESVAIVVKGWRSSQWILN